MSRDLEPAGSRSASLGRKAVAVVVLLIAAAVLIWVVKGILIAIGVPLLIIAAIVAIWWAWRQLR